MISIVIPSYNNLRHLKNAYESVRKHYDDVELILIDDGSDDGTYEWLQSLNDSKLIYWREETRLGHTILYDRGIEKATNEIVGILHADMYIAPNYIENLLKHLQPGKVVCATRVEPPLHPAGPEKIIQDFGLDFDSLKIDEFYKWANTEVKRSKDTTTRGMFAPWVLYKKDFLDIGGHDPGFAPYPFEDSDIFQRWILAGYELLQSRDALVYHLTCRGHRWNDKAGGDIGKNDDQYAKFEHRAARHYIRKWGSWIQNDEYQYPIILPKYDIGIIVENCNQQLLLMLEPWCGRIYADGNIDDYIIYEQPSTSFDLLKRVFPYDNEKQNEILVYIDGKTFNQQDFNIIMKLPEIIQTSGAVGEFKLGNLKFKITGLNTYEKELIKCES